jgi:hypothetical protein
MRSQSMSMFLLEEHCCRIERLEGQSITRTQPLQSSRHGLSVLWMRKKNGNDRCANTCAGLPHQICQKGLRRAYLGGLVSCLAGEVADSQQAQFSDKSLFLG